MWYHAIYKERFIFFDNHFLVIKNNLCFAVNYDEDMIIAMCMISLRATAAFFNIGNCAPFNFTIFFKKSFGRKSFMVWWCNKLLYIGYSPYLVNLKILLYFKKLLNYYSSIGG